MFIDTCYGVLNENLNKAELVSLKGYRYAVKMIFFFDNFYNALFCHSSTIFGSIQTYSECDNKMVFSP